MSKEKKVVELFNTYYEYIYSTDDAEQRGEWKHDFAKKVIKLCTTPHVIGSFSLEFIKWYSGMEEQKILNAYERYKRESGNDR
jgi:hypothetical protein